MNADCCIGAEPFQLWKVPCTQIAQVAPRENLEQKFFALNLIQWFCLSETSTSGAVRPLSSGEREPRARKCSYMCIFFLWTPFYSWLFIIWPFLSFNCFFFFLTHCSFYFTKLWHSRAGSSLRSVQPCLGQGIRYWSCLASIVHASLLNPTPAVYSQWLETFTAWVIH